MAPPRDLTPHRRLLLILATLLALFLAALDTLIMSAAMPTIVSELGGLHLYSWVFSTYMLSRAVALPVFGKLADLFPNRTLYLISILIFLVGSVLAGAAHSMMALTIFRAIQGIGAGGNFALVYIVLSDISEPEDRGRMMSYASFVWGLASVLGPSMGGFIVGWVSWRWIFYINIPIGLISLVGIWLFLTETREKRNVIEIDYAGIVTLVTAILVFLTAFLLGGREYAWTSPPILGLFSLFLLSAVGFYMAEKRSAEPILRFDFFKLRGFSTGNGLVFFASMAIFSLSAFSPIFIQGALGRTPAQLGMVMMFLSLGWSAGALYCGRQANRWGQKNFSLAGGLVLIVGCLMAVRFSAATSLWACCLALSLAGVGMGFTSIATLLVVQNSVDKQDLGVATSSHQFTRTLGGTVGIGVCGSIVTARFARVADSLNASDLQGAVPPAVMAQIQKNFENFFRPDVQQQLSLTARNVLHQAIGNCVIDVFWLGLVAALICLAIGLLMPKRAGNSHGV
ncbi:MFS transporter [Desulfosarcina ovata subsp. sediminis]|uniref:MFS transporter n=1 Tax=Desulfosarcina ovata subsp. sediminis TaxID=885957 RepID=A0A5K7ZUX2_9BACT|nr:MFS transporter [Desulfosarcina ovata]BBO84045.1 MFS transporter [Desulfosarcina ovata subsp. sediminis]